MVSCGNLYQNTRVKNEEERQKTGTYIGEFWVAEPGHMLKDFAESEHSYQDL